MFVKWVLNGDFGFRLRSNARLGGSCCGWDCGGGFAAVRRRFDGEL